MRLVRTTAAKIGKGSDVQGAALTVHLSCMFMPDAADLHQNPLVMYHP